MDEQEREIFIKNIGISAENSDDTDDDDDEEEDDPEHHKYNCKKCQVSLRLTGVCLHQHTLDPTRWLVRKVCYVNLQSFTDRQIFCP